MYTQKHRYDYRNQPTNDPNFKHAAPFHGDKVLIDLMFDLTNDFQVVNFIETGCAYGDSLIFMAANTNLNCLSCEPDETRYMKTSQAIPLEVSAGLVKEKSPDFLYNLNRDRTEPSIFWLDAHGEFNGTIFWPIIEEIKFIQENFDNYFIFIDDFKNPYQGFFKYDMVGQEECGLSKIESLLDSDKVYFPIYDECTSDEPFYYKDNNRVGWCLITNKDLDLNTDYFKRYK
jgi:hypothetical protein